MYLDVHIAPHEVKIVPPSSGPIEYSFVKLFQKVILNIESKIQVY